MKLSRTSQIITITATLVSSTVVGMTVLKAATIPSAQLPITGQFLAKADTALAKQLQGKPVVVEIYASWCPGCKNIAPTLSQLEQQYGSKMSLVVFDVSDSKTTQASIKKATKLGLTNFFNTNKSKTSTVAIIDPASGKVVKQFQNNPELADYTAALDLSIAKMGHGDSMKKTGDAMGHGDSIKK
jgi:thiol-disulfide isomerase/thioredoxin